MRSQRNFNYAGEVENSFNSFCTNDYWERKELELRGWGLKGGGGWQEEEGGKDRGEGKGKDGELKRAGPHL